METVPEKCIIASVIVAVIYRRTKSLYSLEYFARKVIEAIFEHYPYKKWVLFSKQRVELLKNRPN